jgi:DNA processing protein
VTTPSGSDPRLPALALACVRGVGPVAYRKLISEHGDAESALRASATDDARHRALARAAELIERSAARGIDIVVAGEDRYPPALLALEDAPMAFFALGALRHAAPPAVAIVGARRATAYGRRTAQRVAASVAAAGGTVISGLASGIDSEAHEAALRAGGRTVAVLGTGVDVPYPASNSALHARIAADGLVLSESPPGRTAHPGAFPRRNRLIAALADVVLVVEAGVKSGSLITAQVGVALGRSVAAIPGPVDSPTSLGANQLLRDGAHVVTAPEDLLALLALTPGGGTVADRQRLLGGVDGSTDDRLRETALFADSSPEHRVLSVLDAGPQLADDLVRATRVSPRDLGVALSMLTVAGLVDVDHGGLVRRR